MIHKESCTWPDQCAFQEADSSNCLIPDKSGYSCEEARNFDDNGYDGWKPCKYYINWEDAIELLAKCCEER